MLSYQYVFKDINRTWLALLRHTDLRVKSYGLVAVIVAILLASASLTVYAQTENETISTPLELPALPPADWPEIRATPEVPPSAPLDVVTIGLNFQGSQLGVDSNSIPPDTMGAVGPNHIVQMINGRFDVYSKTTGAQIFTRTLDGFWTTFVGLPGGGIFDPRIIFDPASGRWFAASIDGGAGNNIYLARSDTSNPTGDWDGVRFAADTVGVAEFHDYDTLAVDADGVYICTNDFGSFGNDSCYSIPKSDLLQAAPSIARLTRFEATPPGMPEGTGSVQPALDFGPSDGRAALLGVSFGGRLIRSNIFGAGGAGASLGTVTNVAGAPFTSPAPPARQPDPFFRTIENVSPRIVANVFEQGNRLWAVHAVAGSFGNSAVRWYEINEVTNSVIQTGLIQKSNEDYHEPSIAVNDFGNVVIGYTCSGPSLAPSACVSVGQTVGGTTTFESPLVLRPGAGYYFVTGSGTRNRWGDYSATVIDPVDPCTFWTFQEFVAVSGAISPFGGTWGIQITELTFNSCNGDPIADLSYTPVTPCRIVDTRNTSAGIIGASSQRNFRVFGSGGAISAQGGTAAGCPSPLGQPLAAHINMVAVDPTGKGNLQAFPVGAGAGAGLSVNYNTIDTNLANAGTVKTVTGGGPDITVASNFSSTHSVIDVLGYYYPDGDLLYASVTPCRIVDTRNTTAGIIGASTQRNFRVFGSGGAISAQGGTAVGCPSPLGQPLAAHINVVAVDPTGKGNLQAFPVGAGAGAGLSVNYNTIDTNLANAGTVKTVTGSGPDITVASNFSAAHTAIDVLGYYYPAGELLYTPVTPCRIIDTRNTTAGIIGASTQRNFRVFGSGGVISAQGGTAAGCPSPLGQPLAAHINVVAVDPTGKGNLQAFPVGAGAGAGLSVNYNTIDTNLANAGTVKTVTGSGPDITVASNFSSTHTVVDVLGYYYAAP